MRGVENIKIPAEHTPAKVISVLEPEGARVNYDTKIILYESVNPRYSHEDTESEQEPEPEFLRHFLKAQFEGTLKNVLVIEGDVISDKEVVANVEVECTHETLFGGMCVDCGKNLHLSSNKIELERASIKFDHSTNDITTTKKNAEMLDLRDANRLLKARKLTLIIDLDQTIIHASLNTKIAEWMSDPENINYPATHDIGKFTLNDSPSIYYIKPRPFLKRFLEELNPLYEFHIYTMGVRSYALEVVRIIDPEGKYFRERIITRDENLSSTKSISRLFPTDQSMVVAIDDRPDVWEWSPNLIRVVPFEFFPGTGDINASHLPEIKKDDTSSIVPDTSNTSQEKGEEDTNADLNGQNGTDDVKEANGEVSNKAAEESDESQITKLPATNQVQNGHVAQLTEDDKELALTLKQLKRLHEIFYRYQDSPDLQRTDGLQPTVPVLLPHMKSEVLKGVYITFSGIIPMDANPRKQDAWIWAESFGAVCSTDINNKTTHLVATKQTHKVNQALRMPSVKVVHSKWLYDSVTQWEKKNESNYPIPDVDMNQYTNTSSIPIIVDPSEVVDTEKSDAEPNIDENQFHDYLEKWNNEHPSLDDPEIKELFGESFTDIDTDDDFSDANSDYASPTNPDENIHLHPSSAALKQPRSPSLKPPEVAKRRKRKNPKQPNQYLREKIINRISQEESDVSDYENGSPTSSFNLDSPYNDNVASRTPDIHFASDDETPSGASSPSISPNNQLNNENDYMDQDNNFAEGEGEGEGEGEFKDLFQEGLAVLDSDYSDGTNNDMDFDDDTLQSPNDGHQNELNTQQSIHDSGTD